MEKHSCKLCHRRFANGRALGGHMRFHMMNLPVPPKHESTLSEETESMAELSSSASDSDSDSDSDSEDIEADDDGGGGVFVKKSVMVEDLEDRESETELNLNLTRRRSKRRRKEGGSFCRRDFFVDVSEAEQASSVSEVTSEEDVAFCLMMLSRDKWTTCHERDCGDCCNTATITTTTKKLKNRRQKYRCRYRFKCDTCNKVFRSYQALGGHRASHKKFPAAAYANPKNNNNNNNNSNEGEETEVKDTHKKKIYECPFCFRVFASGQALGGHKRSHGIGGTQISNINNNKQQSVEVVAQSPRKNMMKINEIKFIDLNLPAPVDDEDYDAEISQIALSAVSDAHF